MPLIVGTVAGALNAETGEELLGGTRVEHMTRDHTGWWAVDGSGRVHHDGSVVVRLPDDVSPTCVQPTPETVWIGADKARLYAMEHDVATEDEFFSEAPGRETWSTPWGGPPAVRSMTLDADHTLYVNVHVGGILRYDNTGLIPTIDIASDVHQVAAHPTKKGAVFAATGRGLAYSHNGHDFEFRTDGLHARYCRAVLVLGDRVIVTASTGPSSGDGRIYASSLWDGPFEPIGGGLPESFDGNVDTHCLASLAGHLYLGHGDTVWVSGDDGETWSVLERGLPEITCLG